MATGSRVAQVWDYVEMRTGVIGLSSAPSKRLIDLLFACCDQMCLNCGLILV